MISDLIYRNFKLERYWIFKLHNKAILRGERMEQSQSGLAVLTEKSKNFNAGKKGGDSGSGDQLAPLDPR